MANNTTRHFVNRVEIYSDNAGNEAGEELTIIQRSVLSPRKHLTRATMYKQNNSTTYAKNKVIWYRIKLNLDSGDVDKTKALRW